jgi:predicted enzyme related to lactoylglutathione lyase
MSDRIHGAHFLLYSRDPEADRAFFRDVLDLRAVDAGGGWLIFGLPPAEVGVHPAEGEGFQQKHAEQDLSGFVLYFMCDDLKAVVKRLAAKSVKCTEPMTAEWGTATTFPLPSGGRVGLYQPTHATAIAR